MATHSSILAWRIPQTEDPGGLQSMGSQRVGYDCDFQLVNKNFPFYCNPICHFFHFIHSLHFFFNCTGCSLLHPGFLQLRQAGFSLQWPLLLQSTFSRYTGSAVVVPGFSCSEVCRIFQDQRLNPCPLRWQADSYLLHRQGGPVSFIFFCISSFHSFCTFTSINFHVQFTKLLPI